MTPFLPHNCLDPDNNKKRWLLSEQLCRKLQDKYVPERIACIVISARPWAWGLASRFYESLKASPSVSVKVCKYSRAAIRIPFQQRLRHSTEFNFVFEICASFQGHRGCEKKQFMSYKTMECAQRCSDRLQTTLSAARWRFCRGCLCGTRLFHIGCFEHSDIYVY